MRQVYSTKLYQGQISAANTLTGLWTVPTGYVDVIRSIDGYAQVAGPGRVYFYSAGQYWLTMPWTNDRDPFLWRGPQVLVAGDYLEVLTTLQPIVLRVSGYRLAV